MNYVKGLPVRHLTQGALLAYKQFIVMYLPFQIPEIWTWYLVKAES